MYELTLNDCETIFPDPKHHDIKFPELNRALAGVFAGGRGCQVHAFHDVAGGDFGVSIVRDGEPFITFTIDDIFQIDALARFLSTVVEHLHQYGQGIER